MYGRIWFGFAASLVATMGCAKSGNDNLPSEADAQALRDKVAVERRDPSQGERAPSRGERGQRLVRFPTARDAAAEALARIGEEALPLLLESLAADDAPTRARAARALALMSTRDPRAVSALAAALGDVDEEVREQAARALGRMGPAAKAAVPALMKALRQADKASD